MESINKVELAGTIGSATISTISNRQVVRFTVATNLAYKDSTGMAVIETTWTNITYWAKEGEDLSKICKGAKVHILGRLRNQRYVGQDGCPRSVTEVVANQIEII